MKQQYSSYQFVFFRMLLGISLIFFFLLFILDPRNILPFRSFAFLSFPNFVEFPFGNFFVKSSVYLTFFNLVSPLFALLLVFGIARQFMCFLLLTSYIFALHAYPVIPTPEHGFLPLLLLFCLLIPEGEPFSLPMFKSNLNPWRLHSNWPRLAQLLIAASFVYHGGSKLYFMADDMTIWQNLFSFSEILYAIALYIPKIRWQSWSIFNIILLFTHPFALLAQFFYFSMQELPTPEPKANKPIIFIDGICLLCNKFIQIVLSEDQKAYFCISTLQGETAKKLLPAEYREELSTVVLWDNEKIYTKSQAVLRILFPMGAVWYFSVILFCIPSFLLNFFYTIVAKLRYRLFGKKEVCSLPSAEDRSRLLE